VPGVRCADAALAFFAVQRDGIRGEFFAPEGILESLPEHIGFSPQVRAALVKTQGRGDFGDGALSRIHVSLHLAQCDGCVRQAAILMEDGILRILPPLMEQAFRRPAAVFHKPVPVKIAVGVDPLQREFNVRPDGAKKIEISGAFVICRREHHE